MQHTPTEEGPYASLLLKLAKLQAAANRRQKPPIRIAIVTARNYLSEMRVSSAVEESALLE